MGSFSRTRSLADRARGFCAASSLPGLNGVLVTMRHVCAHTHRHSSTQHPRPVMDLLKTFNQDMHAPKLPVCSSL